MTKNQHTTLVINGTKVLKLMARAKQRAYRYNEGTSPYDWAKHAFSVVLDVETLELTWNEACNVLDEIQKEVA